MSLTPVIVIERMITGIEGIRLSKDERTNHRAIYSMIFAAMIDTHFRLEVFDNLAPKEIDLDNPIRKFLDI